MMTRMDRMDCSEVCDLLPSFLDEELAGDERKAIAQHLETCSHCAAALEQSSALRRRIRDAGTFAPPAGLEDRLRLAIGSAARERAATWEWRRVAALAASHLLVAALGGVLAYAAFMRGEAREQVTQAIVSAHVRALISGEGVQVASSDTHTVKPWFIGKLPFAPVVRDLSASGFPLIGARVDYVLERPAAALVYSRRKHRIDLFVLPAEQAGMVSELRSDRHGFNIVAWRHGAFAYLTASDLNAAELTEFSRALRAFEPG